MGIKPMNRRGQKIAENLVYYLIWLTVFIVTAIGYSTGGQVRWDEVGRFWLRASPFFILFLVNNYLLLPRLLLKKKYGTYVALALAAILLVTAFNMLMFRNMMDKFPPHGAFPQEGPSREFAQPVHESPMGRENFDPADQAFDRWLMEGRRPDPGIGQMPLRPFPLKWGLTLNKFLLALLLVGFNIAVKLIFKTIHDSRKIEEMEKQHLRAELDYLKAQVNPHFFMNTLNNIHALVDIDTEKAKETIIELSKIMRYILYETDKPFVPLRHEVKFIDNYISLMSIRYSGKVTIDNHYPEAIPEGTIPPLMLITLTENAFKHGISYRRDSFIRTELTVCDDRLIYTVTNSTQEKNPQEKGVGLENLRKRLSLLYGSDFRLELTDRGREHLALLDIPIER